MAEGSDTPLAVAAVSVEFDEGQIGSEVVRMQRELGAATSEASTAIGETGSAAADTSSGLNKLAAASQASGVSASSLTRSMMMLSRSMSSGTMSGRSMLGMMKMMGPAAMKAAAVVGAAFVGLKIARSIVDWENTLQGAERAGKKAGEWFMDSFIRLAATRQRMAFAKIFDADAKRQATEALDQMISGIGDPKTMQTSSFIDQMFAVDKSKMDTAHALAIAKAEAIGEDTSQLREQQAKEEAKMVIAHAEAENDMLAKGKQETARNYLSIQEDLDSQIAKTAKQINDGYADLPEKERGAALAADLEAISGFNKKKVEANKASLNEMGTLNAQEAANNASIAEAEAQAEIAALRSVSVAQASIAALRKVEQARLSEGGESVWAAAMKAITGTGKNGQPAQGKFLDGNIGAADIANTLAVEKAIESDKGTDSVIAVGEQQVKALKTISNDTKEVIRAIRERGGSVWLPGGA